MRSFVNVLGPAIAGHQLLASFLFLLLFGFTLPISEEIALALVGVGARSSGIAFLEIGAVSAVALILADLGYYGLARFVGPRILGWRMFSKVIKSTKIEAGERYFHERGPRIVFICRFVVGLRAPAILSAGFLRMSLRKFVIYDGLALLICVPVWLAVGHALGTQLDSEVGRMGKLLAVVAVAAAVVASSLIYRSVKKDRARADARLLGSKEGD